MSPATTKRQEEIFNGLLGGTMRRRGMTHDAILAALQAENLSRCEPPLDASEVAIIAKSVSRYEPDQVAALATASSGQTIVYPRITAAELASNKYDIRFHIPEILVAGQPQGMFGAKKTLKTNMMLDQAIAIATGNKWLGYFQVAQPARVAVFSGESGMATIQETCLRICRAGGIDLKTANMIFTDHLPVFGDTNHMDALEKFLTDDAIELAYFDPVYLAMITGGREGSIFEMGRLLRSVAELCQRIGVTPVLLHHMKKSVADAYSPGDLDDASWAGFAEFCRGWMLINRRERYEPGTGLHRLWISVGGSVGHSSLWGVDVYEGFHPRRVWEVKVLKPDQVISEQTQVKAQAKATKQAASLNTAKTAITEAMANYPAGETANVIKIAAGVSGTRANLALAELIRAGQIVPCGVLKACHKTPFEGYRLAA